MPNYTPSPQAASLELIRRRAARSDLHSFIQYLNPDYLPSDFSRTLCDSLDEFLVDMMLGKRPILCVMAPPQHGKTEIVSRYLPAYALGRFPPLKIGGMSYGASLSAAINRDVQRRIMCDEYEALFPETKLNDNRVVNADVGARRNTEMFEVVGTTGSYIAQGVGGALTGYRLDLGIIDDPIKNSQEARSTLVKDSIWSWYLSTFLTRLSKNSGQIIMATRWALDDLTGRILEAYPNAKQLKFKAINNQGEALVPDLHPLDKLLEVKRVSTDYFWSAMYQQEPIPDEGGDFKPEQIQLVDAVPPNLSWVRGWDLAATTKKTSDYTASCRMAIKDGVVWIDGIDNQRLAPHEVEALIVQRAKTDTNTRQSISQDPGQAGVAQKASLSRKLQGARFTFSTESGDKRTRAMPLAAQVNVGNVRLVNSDTTHAFLKQLESFPNGSHDDMVDAASRAYNELLDGSGYSLKNL